MANSTALVKNIITKKLSNDVVVAQYYMDTTVNNLVSGTDYSLFYIPKGAIVFHCGIAIDTGEGAADTVDLGVTGALTQFLNDKSLETAGTLHVSAEAGAYFATADIYLTLLANAAVTAANNDNAIISFFIFNLHLFYFRGDISRP